MKTETKPFMFLKKTRRAWAFSFLLITMFANVLRLCDVPHSRMLKISTKVHSGILQNRCYGLAFNDNALDGLCKIHKN